MITLYNMLSKCVHILIIYCTFIFINPCKYINSSHLVKVHEFSESKSHLVKVHEFSELLSTQST